MLNQRKLWNFSILIAICRKLPSQNSEKHRTEELWPCKIPKNEDSKVLWFHKNDKQTWGKEGGRGWLLLSEILEYNLFEMSEFLTE